MLLYQLHAEPTEQDKADIDAALTTLENKLPYLVGLELAKRRKLNGMGPQTSAFADQALQAAIQHEELMPRGLDIARIESGKELREFLLPRFERLRALNTRMDHTLLLVGHEYYAGALAIYKALKAFGKSAGLEDLLMELKRRFKRARRTEGEGAAAEELPDRLEK